MTLSDLLNYAETQAPELLARAEHEIDARIDADGPTCAAAVAAYILAGKRKQTPVATLTGDAAGLKTLEDATFEEFEHLLRGGGPGVYTGATRFPALHAAADAIYAEGQCRSVIRVWCNAAARAALGM